MKLAQRLCFTDYKLQYQKEAQHANESSASGVGGYKVKGGGNNDIVLYCHLLANEGNAPDTSLFLTKCKKNICLPYFKHILYAL